jgi:hypothetical protein
MVETVKGRYRNGKIELGAPLDLQDGAPVEVLVTPSDVGVTVDDGPASPAGGWVGNVPDDFEEQVYADRRRDSRRPPAQW